jgi:Streptomyces sporulation and cell division protein, SsgA
MSKVVVETAGWIRGEVDVETVEVELAYETTDPYAVRVHLSGVEGQRCWTFGRDLMADGLRSMVPVGEGAVQVQATSVLTEITYLDLDGRSTTLRLPWWNTREFIRLSQEAVARGDERCDVDSWVMALTDHES